MTALHSPWDWGIIIAAILDEVPSYSIYDIVEVVEERVGRLNPEDRQTVMAVYHRITIKREEFEPGIPVNED